MHLLKKSPFLILLFCSSCVLWDKSSAPDSVEKAPAGTVDKSAVFEAPSIEAPPVGKGDVAKKPSGLDEYRSWLKTCTLDALAKTVPKDQVWSKEADAFVKAALQAEAGEPGATSWESLSNQAQALVSKGCDAPLARLWIGEAIFKAGRPDVAAAHLRKSAARLQRWEYPKLELALASDRLAVATMDDQASQDIAKAAMNLASATMAETAADSGAYAPPSQFAVYAGLRELQSRRFNPKFWHVAFDTASRISDYPKDLLDILSVKAVLEEAKEGKAGEAYSKAIELAKRIPDRPEPYALAIEALSLNPSAASPAEAKRLLEKAAAAQFDYDEAYLAYAGYLSSALASQPAKLMDFGRLCLDTGRFDTPIPRIYLSTLLKKAAAEASFNWRVAFLAPGVAADLERLYLGLINALPPDAKDARDVLAMERCLLLAWCGDYEAAKALFSKVPAEISLLNMAFKDFQIPWKPHSIAEFEGEMRGFTGAQKAVFQQWDDAMCKADLENAVKFASKLIAANAIDKPLRNLIRLRTAWRLAGEPACRILPSEETDPLTFALTRNRPEVAKFMLENGMDLKRRGRDSSTPLLLALSNGLPESIVKMLVSKGCDPDYKDPESGATPMTMAIEKNMPSAAEFMAEMGADPNARLAASGRSALHVASLKGMGSLVKTLLKRGAKPNAQDLKGETPLHCAVAVGSADCAQALLARGADPSIKNVEGQNPMDIAAQRGNEALLKLMQDAPPPRAAK